MWSSWRPADAVGYGAWTIENCIPSSAQATYRCPVVTLLCMEPRQHKRKRCLNISLSVA